MAYGLEADRIAFFSTMKTAKTSFELARAYIVYDGHMYGDQRDVFMQSFNRLRLQEGSLPFPPGAMDQESAISKEYLRSNYPQLEKLYFETASLEPLSSVEMLAETRNPYLDLEIPTPPNLRMMRSTRAAVRLYRVEAGATLFVFPHGYQLFRRDIGAAYPDARSRCFARTILDLPRRPTSNPIVIIQDPNDGDNFAHFLFDWIPRIAHFVRCGIETAKNCRFVLGGAGGPMQRALLEQICSQYGLSGENFIIPKDRYLIEMYGPCFFFTDQKRTPLHPAHMAHPASMEIVCDTIAGVTRERAPYKRIFISRGDAALRRIVNENEVIARLEPHGFHVVRLSEHNITEQIALIRGAEIVAGAHGMGLTHIAAQDRRLSVLELFHPNIGSDAYIFVARALGFDHQLVIGQDAHDGRAGYSVDVDIVAKKINALVTPSAGH